MNRILDNYFKLKEEIKRNPKSKGAQISLLILEAKINEECLKSIEEDIIICK